MVRSSRGRQKIEMKKISKESNLQVSFSKRRYGLFKKASELCTLCGAKILIIVFSPGGKVFSFGNPNVKDLIYRFSNEIRDPFFFHHYNNLQLVATRPDETIQRLNQKLTEELEIQEREKNKRKLLKSYRESRQINGNWWEKDVKELDMNQTNSLIYALQDLKNSLATNQMGQISQNNNYFGESSNNININPTVNIDHNVGGGIDLFDQRRMSDLSAFSCNPNMIVPEARPTYEYCNTRGFVPEYNMNYVSGNNNFNQS